MPDPECVELPDDRVVKSELGVVGQVVGSLPLGDDGVLQGGVLVGQTASANRVTVDGLNLGDVSTEVVGEELANGLLSPGISSLVTLTIKFLQLYFTALEYAWKSSIATTYIKAANISFVQESCLYEMLMKLSVGVHHLTIFLFKRKQNVESNINSQIQSITKLNSSANWINITRKILCYV